MKITFIIIAFLFVAFIVGFFILGFISKSGEPSGLIEGRLAKCPNKPNCVCSEYTEDANHYIEPISIAQDITFDALPILKNIIRELGGNIQTESDHYLAATFTSAIFGFVDDLEISIDATQKIVHIRSASRVGNGDGGVNKKRTELLKERYNKNISEARH